MAENGMEVEGRNPTIYDLAFDFHSQRFAISSADGRIRVYAKGKSKYEQMDEFKVDVRARKLAWAPPHFGQVFAAASLDDNIVRIYEETVSEKPRFRRVAQINNAANPTDLAFKPGAEPSLKLTLAVPSTDGKVRVYEASDAMSLKEWKKTSELEAGKTECTGLAWNPNYFEIPSLLVACGEELAIWDFYKEQHRWVKSQEFPSDFHTSNINKVAWAPSMGRSFHLVATASDTTRIFKLKPKVDQQAGKRFEVEPELKGDAKTQVWDVQWNLTGSVLASSDAEGRVVLWKRDFVQKWQRIMNARSKDDQLT
uniref:Anaphase-promoting complex subunit 4 WD40 domain-containing protein n=1 Tax=Lotharella globosa TaxID=91324 RepID=A0A6U3CYF0_9EUKA|eukprot:CAMPEP_0167789148 /NCGR_PEP_ID=MMETSP0111_2-20121227/10502_1 /TAXON_ID=91324 /ORGANISM="Lotharella globosa, Strain CCCM811" /LENGTH=310 /DNA_ID=CAMNT_0007681239 /DNA_START=8 /DNA_END=940 /DNA_ORIENTATION=+